MTDESLLKAAYKYFPQGIDAIVDRDSYTNSTKFMHLSNSCRYELEKTEDGAYNSFFDAIRNIDISKYFFNATRFNFFDRAHNLQLSELKDNKLYSICLNVSIIVPHYIIYVLETDVSYPEDNFGLPKISKTVRSLEAEEKYRTIIDAMAAQIESFFNVTPLSKEKLQTIIPDITFETIRPGQFTFYNAFFLDDYYIMM
jgi:hypothetical protein